MTILPVTREVDTQTATNLEELHAQAGNDIRRVTLSCELSEVPPDILTCSPNVEFLDLSRNNLATLPDWIDQLSSLRILFLSYNRFTEIPEVVGRCRSLRMLGMRNNQIEHIPTHALPNSLRWLTLTNNYISSLPESIGTLPGLQKLLLAGNRLSNLPTSLKDLNSLELIRLSANTFETFPEWLFEIPSLAWIALAGNPCTSVQSDIIHKVPAISWKDLSLEQELGRGASGSTYRAIHRTCDGRSCEVAVKVFTSHVSSDGTAQDEMAAAIHAGRHSNLTSTIAPLEDHPESQSGMILDLIPPWFKNLAAPPSFESCTRDVYSADVEFSLQQMTSYALDIASAANHLHRLSIIHGDLYAHNILVDTDRALLSDFGAACRYDTHTEIQPALIQRVEVHAFGILLNELLTRTHPSTSGTHESLLKHIVDIANLCTEKRVALRPSFEEVERLLSACKAKKRGLNLKMRNRPQ